MDAIQSVISSRLAYCKFLAANDTGLTGGHQSGIYIAKDSWPLLFDTPGERGSNKNRRVSIRWQDGSETYSNFIYYGTGTRNEYRITCFGRNFPWLRPDRTGDLFVFAKLDDDHYSGFFLRTEKAIEQFLDAFGLSPAGTNHLIRKKAGPQDSPIPAGGDGAAGGITELEAVQEYIAGLGTSDFPLSADLAAAARDIQNRVYDHIELVRTNPDKKLLQWLDIEYTIFRALETACYGNTIARGFTSVDSFVSTANMVLNRRKSRAGKSLEHHLAAIFRTNGLSYTAQALTEGHKRPDFLFPSQDAYMRKDYPADRLVSLAAKTTCKDRWRQILIEADRLRSRKKFLFTLQQGMSPAQMDEMQKENVVLVVPREYIGTYPPDRQNRILSLKQFISYVADIEHK